MRTFKSHPLILFAALVTVLLAHPLAAATPTYVHPSDPTCGGLSPCYYWIHDAIQNTDTDGTVIVLASKGDNIFQTYSKTGITVRGVTPDVTITGGVNVTTSVMTGWTIRDLVFTSGVVIQDIATSLTLDNIKTSGIQIGYTTQNTTAAITVNGCTFPTEGTQLAILGGSGFDLGGSITVSNNVNISALNIFSYVAATGTADITADITISDNHFLSSVSVIVNSDGTTGVGSVTGAVQFLRNTLPAATGALGVIVNGNASGNVSGPITFTGNVGNALVVGTYDSVVGGSLGSITATGNDVEAIEINDKGAPLIGPVLMSGNTITSKGGGAASNPYIQVDGTPITGNVTIENTLGDQAFLSTTSWSTGDYSGAVTITGNSARRIVIDSRTGSLTAPFMISNNTLPAAAEPDSSMTIRTLNGGDCAGGTVSTNTLDNIQFDIAGGLSGALAVTGNVTREAASLIAKGAVGAGIATVTGNDMSGIAYLQSMNTTARFNRIDGVMSVVAGSPVDARYNWWGCNTGPGTAPCSSISAGIPASPYLVARAATRCTSATSVAQTVHLLQASDYSLPGGNTTPASALVSTTQGTVDPATVPIVGLGVTTVTLPPAATATISSAVDNVFTTWPPLCDPDVTTAALYAPSSSVFYLRNGNTSGYANLTVTFGAAGALPLMGDWNGDGVATPGLYFPATSQFFLKNSLLSGTADIGFSFGPGGAGWLPLVGDWNNDGLDTVGLYAPSSSMFFLRNTNSGGYADVTFAFGLGGAGWLPIAGDWNNDGTDTVGLYVPSSSQFFLRNSNTGGYADASLGFGPGGAGWTPLAGDWNGDGTDTVGLYAPSSSQFFLRNTNTSGYADVAFSFGPGSAGWKPVVGDFDGP